VCDTAVERTLAIRDADGRLDELNSERRGDGQPRAPSASAKSGRMRISKVSSALAAPSQHSPVALARLLVDGKLVATHSR
jgi:hypothetical protein